MWINILICIIELYHPKPRIFYHKMHVVSFPGWFAIWITDLCSHWLNQPALTDKLNCLRASGTPYPFNLYLQLVIQWLRPKAKYAIDYNSYLRNSSSQFTISHYLQNTHNYFCHIIVDDINLLYNLSAAYQFHWYVIWSGICDKIWDAVTFYCKLYRVKNYIKHGYLLNPRFSSIWFQL